jgi:hypothetical protein
MSPELLVRFAGFGNAGAAEHRQNRVLSKLSAAFSPLGAAEIWTPVQVLLRSSE